MLGEDVSSTRERFGLFWPGKNDAMHAAQIPTTATLAPDLKNSVDWDRTDNIFIEGDNLEVLKILQKHYYGKIKCIYIEISLMKTHTAPMLPDSAPLREAISAAKKINLDSYTAESVSTLNDALSNSEILLSGSAYTNDDIVYLHQAVISAINSLQKRPFTNLTIVPHKTSYHVTDVISPDDISVNGVYAAGAGSVELNPSQYSLHYDFSQPGAATVTVSLAASLSAENSNLTETYSVNVTSLASGTSLPCKSLPASSHMRSANNTETAEQHTAHNHNQKSSHQKSTGRHHLALTGLSYTESGIIALCALLISIACFIPRKVHQH